MLNTERKFSKKNQLFILIRKIGEIAFQEVNRLAVKHWKSSPNLNVGNAVNNSSKQYGKSPANGRTLSTLESSICSAQSVSKLEIKEKCSTSLHKPLPIFNLPYQFLYSLSIYFNSLCR